MTVFSEPASVSIEIPDALARLTDGATLVEVEAATGAEALHALWQRFPKLQSRVLDRHGRLYPYLLLVHNGRTVSHGELATRPLQPGDRLEIVALAEGGLTRRDPLAGRRTLNIEHPTLNIEVPADELGIIALAEGE